jgi:hypothetical protein
VTCVVFKNGMKEREAKKSESGCQGQYSKTDERTATKQAGGPPEIEASTGDPPDHKAATHSIQATHA